MRHASLTTLLLTLLVSVTACAADRHLKQAQSALIRGDAVAAQHHYQQALRQRSSLAEDEVFVASLQTATRDAETERGLAALQHGQPRAAAAHFDRALAQAPRHAPALEGRARAGSAAAADLFDAATERSDYADLPAARRLLDEAIRLDPSNAGVTAALASLGPDRVPGVTAAQAEALADAGGWADAAALWRAEIDADPFDLPARAALHTLRGRAADDLIRHARETIAQGDPDRAERRFRAALAYRPGDPRVRVGLALADALRGDGFIASGRPGAALLAYRRAAAANRRLATAEAGTRTARERLLAEHTVRVAVRPDEGSIHSAALQELTARVDDLLSQRSDGVMRPAPASSADFRLNLAIATLSIHTTPPTAERRQYDYTIETDVPNPRIPVLRERRHHYARRVERLADDERDLCRRLLSVRVDSNHGLHASLQNRLDRVRRDLRRARRDFRDVEHELACEPAFIVDVQPAAWPYTVETFTQTGQLAGRWSLLDEAPAPFHADFRERDEMILDANPAIGLDEDPLELTDEATVRLLLIDRATNDIARSIGRRLTQRYAAVLMDRARVLETQHEVEAALELRVSAALLRAVATDDTADADLDGLTRLTLPEVPASED